ncbi:MAG: ABC transporter substrate-binding protein, partial [Dehalococcoidia bacterium]
MSNRTMVGLLMCILLLGSMLAGCPAPQEEVKVEVPQEVVAGLGRDAGGVYGGAHHHPPLTRLFEMLVTTGFESEVVPQLATSWEVSDDGLTWTFYLRKGVYFHDGTPFNAEAAKFALEMHNIRRPGHLGPIASLTAIDGYTLQIIHTEPFAPLLHQLTWPLFSMAASAAFDEKGVIVNPIGTGPFKEEEWIPGERLVLVRNEDYWGGTPKLERITLM